jgi:hypothetical protein
LIALITDYVFQSSKLVGHCRLAFVLNSLSRLIEVETFEQRLGALERKSNGLQETD